MKVVLDTNVLISAFAFGGKPQEIFLLVIEGKLQGVTSRVLLAEFLDVVSKKFPIKKEELSFTEQQIKEKFIFVQPKKALHIVRDEDDNRVIEAAIEGGCDYIITGDKELLELGIFRKIRIITSDQFLKI